MHKDATSGAEQALSARLAQLKPGTPRYDVVAAAKAFKSSWLSLAKHLAAVRQGKLYTGWGYASFAAYCQGELHVRQQTADKLTRSYGFLAERAPQVLEASAGATRDLPPLDVVDLLRQARGRTEVNAPGWQTLEGQVLAGDGPENRGQLMERLHALDPQQFPNKKKAAAYGLNAAEVQAAQPVQVDPHSLRKVLLLAERVEMLLKGMQAELDDDHVVRQAADVAEKLRQKSQRYAPVGKVPLTTRASHLPDVPGMQ